MNLDEVKQLNIPTAPGCYQFLDRQGRVIYIGKAANLRARVFSYWRTSAALTPAKEEMIDQVKEIKWIETDSEIEALLLEANLIKKQQPIFNVKLRDDKRFVYLKISTEEEWPRIFITRQLEKSGQYFGPFTSVMAVRTTLKVIRKIWPFRSCARLPKKACLYYRLGQCPGMCIGQADKQGYQKTIREIILFLEGKKKRIIKDYQKQIKSWELKQKKYPVGSGEREEAEAEIERLKFRLFNLEKVLATANVLGAADKYAADVVELAKVLGLPRPPQRIEGYDIANIFGRQAVGSMVVFIDGEPEKSEYRRFKIKVGQGRANDVGMLKEVLERRFKNDWPRPDLIVIDGGRAQLQAAEQVLKEYKLNIPILAIAKGEGLRSARARDKIFFPGQAAPLKLPLASPALHILKRVRDEAHRFALSYHRLLRKKKILTK
jgi:excinuclease ABC subunit C